MLLITLNEWFGPSRDAMDRKNADRKVDIQEVTEELVTFATRLPQREALERIMKYQEAFNAHYSKVTAVNFKIITVAKVPDITDELLTDFQTQLVEDLSIDSEDE